MKQLLQKYTAFGARLRGSGLGPAPPRLGRQSPPPPGPCARAAPRSCGTKAFRTAAPAVLRRPAPASGCRQTRLLVTPGYAELPWRGSILEARGRLFPPPRA